MRSTRVAGENRFDLLDHPVVLGVEHGVHGGQADVLVDAAVARDEVLVERGVVIARQDRLTVPIEHRRTVLVETGQKRRRRLRADRRRAMGDVVEEGVTCAEGICRHRGARGGARDGCRRP